MEGNDFHALLSGAPEPPVLLFSSTALRPPGTPTEQARGHTRLNLPAKSPWKYMSTTYSLGCVCDSQRFLYYQ